MKDENGSQPAFAMQRVCTGQREDYWETPQSPIGNPLHQHLNNNKMEKNKETLFTFRIETFDGSAYFNFITMAKTHKVALRHLQSGSSDFKRLVKNDADLTITITKSK